MPSFPARLPLFVAASGLALSAMPLLPVAAAGSFAWTQSFTTSAPSARFAHNMVYDSARGVTVLFGGANPSGYLNDTWEWNGQSWTQRVSAVFPHPRPQVVVADDAAPHATGILGGPPPTKGFLRG